MEIAMHELRSTPTAVLRLRRIASTWLTMRRTALCTLCAGIAGVAGACFAQDTATLANYPSRPVRVVTPAAPGGTTDILARLFSTKLAEELNQSFIVDNRPSGNGVIAAELTKNSPPDGYTLFLGYTQHTINAVLMPRLPYHAVNDFTTITQLTRAGLLLVVSASHPTKSAKEFVDWARTYQGPINYGSGGGIGSGGHLAGALFTIMTGINAQHIAYKGGGPSITGLLSGEHQFNFAGMQSAQALVRAGKLKGLAVTTSARATALPDVPALGEVLPGFEVVGWYGFMAPPRMPAPLLAKLHAQIAGILKSPDTRERIIAAGSEPVGSSPEEFRRFLLADMAKWAKVLKESGARLE